MTKPDSTIAQLLQHAQQHENSGNVQQAENCYRQIINAHAKYHPAWHAWGLLSYHAGNLDFAVELISKAVRFQPDSGLYHRNLGELQRRLGRLDQAIHSGIKACQLSPDELDSHYNLGLAFTDHKDYTRAITAYNLALKLNPEHGLSWNNLGSALEQQGDKDAAQKAYTKAVNLNSQHSEAQNNLGAIYSERGQLAQARQCFEAAIATDPKFVEAHQNLSSLKTYTRDDPHFTALQALYKNRTQLNEQTRIRCCFAYAKALDDVKDYNNAFAAYQEGNQLQHRLSPMDEQRADLLLAEIIAVFNTAFFKKHTPSKQKKNNHKTPIFIVGMPRSGTTLLEQILCSHPSVYGAGELSDLNNVISELTQSNSDKPFIHGVATLSSADIKKIGDNYIERVWKHSPSSHYITDKMPANFFYLGLLHLAMPHAKIIHAMRDPMDSCFSNYSRLFNDTMEFAYDQGTLGRYYVRYMKLMQHWHQILPKGSILDLHYEKLVNDTETQARRILEFVGLPWDTNCLEFHKNDRLVKTASVAQVRKPIYKTSVARWKHFEQQLQPLLHIVKDYTQSKPLSATAPIETNLLTADNISLEQAMVAANQHQQAGQLPQAEAVLTQLLQVQSDYAPAIQLLGVIAHQVGKPEQAIQLILHAIRIQPETALYHSNIAEMYRQQGQIDKAIEHGRQATQLAPDMASAHSNLGIAYYDAKNYEQAQLCHQQALQYIPHLAQSLNNMGSIERARKNSTAAIDWYQQAIASNPQHLESLSNLAAVLIEEDQTDEAILILEQALTLAPNYAKAICNMGLARFKRGEIESAIRLFQQALQLEPNYPESMVGMATCLREQGDLEASITLLNKAITLKPNIDTAYCQLGTAYMEQGEAEKAQQAYQQALTLDPKSVNALTGLGNLRLEAGDIDEAETLLNQAIMIDPGNLGARFHLTQTKKVQRGNNNLTALESLLKDVKTLSTDKQISLHYALGKAYDDLKDYDLAFPHFLEGARLKRSMLNYDAKADQERINQIINLVDKPLFNSLLGAGVPSNVPIFILGMPRSGTTLTEQIIASHPNVYGAGELHDLMTIVQRQIHNKTLVFPDSLQSLDPDTLSTWGQDYITRLHRRAPHAKHITDKMPINYMVMGLIPLMLPHAKIIHVKRNPIDTCISCFTRLFNRHQDATYNLNELGQHYASYARLMNHWQQIMPPDSFIEVHYEHLVADIEGQARRLIKFCNLTWDDSCLDFYNNKRSIRTASVTQVRQPIYTRSVERWRHYEDYLQPLLESLGEFAVHH